MCKVGNKVASVETNVRANEEKGVVTMVANKTVVAREENTTTRAMKAINRVARRFYDKDGVLLRVDFEFGNNDYSMFKDGTLFRKDDRLGRYIVFEPHYCKKGIYPEYCIGELRIKAYVLALLLSDDNFYDTYMSNNSYVVNHKVVGYEFVNYGNKTLAVPVKSVSHNPKYLEVVTTSENTKHGNFIRDYGLDGVSISAKDIDDKELLKDLVKLESVNVYDRADTAYANRIAVEKYYRGLGVSDEILFN